jgi:hypothetical protein
MSISKESISYETKKYVRNAVYKQGHRLVSRRLKKRNANISGYVFESLGNFLKTSVFIFFWVVNQWEDSKGEKCLF